MLSFFRRVSKSKIGTWIMAAILIAILAGFAMSDLRNFGSGNIGFGMGSSTLVKVGGRQVTEQEMQQAMERRLQEVRQQRPEANLTSIMSDFEPMLSSLIDQKTVIAFADKFGFRLSKRQIDGEIAQLPGAKGLNGKFSEEGYQQFLARQKMSDAEVREIISGEMLQRMLLIPVATNPRISVGMATPVASMLLESREGEAAAIPVENFRAGLNPTDANLQSFYAANRGRYMVPEQRVLRIARIGPEQVANIAASDQEIAAAYNTNKATYAPSDTRSLSQVVVPTQAGAAAIAAKVKGGTPLATAAGSGGAVSTLADQSRDAYAGVAGAQAATAVFSAKQGETVGPFKSDFGWVVAKIDSIKSKPGKTLDQARAEIATKLTADKRKQAIEDLVDKLQNATDDGASFSDAAAQAKLPVTATPLITAAGTSRTDAAYKAPAELASVIKTGFDIAPSDPPEIIDLAGGQGYAMVSPAQVVPAAPAPLASIRDQAANDWITDQARQRAATAARTIADKAERGVPLAQAMKEAGVSLPPVRPLAYRRLQIATAQGPVPPVLQLLFTLPQGKSRMITDPKGGGFFVVKVNKVVPGNAMLQPALINRMQAELAQPAQQEYAQQFVTAMRAEMKVKRNDAAIAAMKARLASSGE